MNKSEVRRAFAKRLAQALKDMGYEVNNQKSLGELFGTTGQAVRKWLRGESLPTNARFPSVASTLEVRLAWLRDGELPMRSVEVKEESAAYTKSKRRGNLTSISAQEYTLLKHFRRVPPSTQEAIRQLLKSLDEDQ